MKFQKNFFLFTTSLLITACAGHSIPQEERAGPQSAKVVQRKYIIRERSHTEPPIWTYDLAAYTTKASADFVYFVGESGDINDKIAGCDMAKARGKQELSQEIVSFVKTKMSESAEGQAVIDKLNKGNPALERTFKSIVSQESVAMLAGVKIGSTVWEERDYSESDGANSVFNCKALVMMNKKFFDNMLEKAAKRAIEEISP